MELLFCLSTDKSVYNESTTWFLDLTFTASEKVFGALTAKSFAYSSFFSSGIFVFALDRRGLFSFFSPSLLLSTSYISSSSSSDLNLFLMLSIFKSLFETSPFLEVRQSYYSYLSDFYKECSISFSEKLSSLLESFAATF